MSKWDWNRAIWNDRHTRRYTLSIASDRTTLGCSCPDWTNRRDKRLHGCCKHLVAFLQGEYEDQGVLPPRWLEHPLLSSWTPRSLDPAPIDEEPAAKKEMDLAAGRPVIRADYVSQIFEEW